eukprot:2022402-Rhodomonas_salina.1
MLGFETKLNPLTDGGVKQAAVYGAHLIASRNELPMLCMDATGVVKIVVRSGYFDGKDITKGKWDVWLAVNQHEEMEPFLAACSHQAHKEAVGGGLWGGHHAAPSVQGLHGEESRFGSLWKDEQCPGVTVLTK